MTFLETYGKQVVAFLVPLATWALNTFFRAKAKLLFASPHTFTFWIDQPLVDAQGIQIAPRQTVHTRSLMVWNTGRETATKVEWVFNWRPLCIQLWSPRHFEEHIEADNRYVMIFDSLAPNEYVGCELMSVNKELPFLVTVRCDQCIAQTINMYPQPAISNSRKRIGAGLQLAGLALVVYATIVILQYLVLKTPLGR
jgi:hypothetical protein